MKDHAKKPLGALTPRRNYRPKRKLYIAYGSNLNKEQMAHRCPTAEPVGTAVINDYKLVFRGNSKSGVANIEPCKGHTVPIAVWDIGPIDEISLDRYEGYPHLYTKQDFEVVLRSGKKVTAMAYVMTPNRRMAEPSNYYLETIAQGYDDFGLDAGELFASAEESRMQGKIVRCWECIHSGDCPIAEAGNFGENGYCSNGDSDWR